jgi:phosphate:Na+ symporter
MLVETFRPVETAPVLGNALAALTADPILDMLLAAILTFAAHSSVAVVLLLAGLSAGGVVTPASAIALVLGANLGGALPPVLETKSASPSNRQVPIGNLLFRVIGCAIVLPFAHPIAEALWRYGPDPRSATTTFHLVFNAGLAVACLGLLGPAGALLTRLFPEKLKPEAEVAQPLFLDPETLETPYLALSNAAREILRMGDLVDALLRLVPIATKAAFPPKLKNRFWSAVRVAHRRMGNRYWALGLRWFPKGLSYGLKNRLLVGRMEENRSIALACGLRR